MARLPPGKPQPDPAPPLAGSVQREEKGPPRAYVRIIRCSTRLLDEDNLWGSVKPLLDQLRAAKLIRGDDPASIELKVEQFKERKRDHCGTQVIIDYDHS